MAQLAVNCIVAGQTISEKSGNATLRVFDLDAKTELKITLKQTALSEAMVNDITPRQLVFDGVMLRTYDGNTYLTASNVAGAAGGNGKKPGAG